jgi:hypothetical protein
MPEQERSSKSAPPLWPSLVIATILAIAIPVIHFFVSDPFGLTVIFLPIYIPLTFAFIWPILVAYQGPISGLWLPRHKAAIILFLASLPFCVFFLRMEIQAANSREAEVLRGKRESDLHAKEHEAARSTAGEALAARGPLGFTEPLKPGEATAIARFIYGHPDISAEELLRISEHYQNPEVMYDLTRHKSCPPEALSVLYEKAIKQVIGEGNSASNTYKDAGDTLMNIARHPNTPPEVLGKLLVLDGSILALQNARGIALENPHSPKSEKIAYMRTLCGPPRKGFYSQSELRFAASDSDTAPETLECLAGQQDIRYYVAGNPHAPLAVLERLTQPDVDALTRNAAQRNISAHRTERQ